MSNNHIHSSITNCLQANLKNFFAKHNSEEPDSGLYQRIMSEVEKELINETLLYCGNIQSKASKILGINRNTLRKKIQNLGCIDIA